MLYYLIQSSLYFVLLYAFYSLVLKNLGYFQFSRVFLICLAPLCLYLPTIQIEAYNLNQLGLFSGSSEMVVEPLAWIASDTIVLEEMKSNGILPDWLVTIYLLGFGWFLIRLLISLGKLVHIYHHSKKQEIGGKTYLITKKANPAFSFFSLIFLHPDFSARGTYQEYVLKHENVHCQQFHSADLLLAQLFQVVFWFHPLAYRLSREIRLNHEFLADSGVCKSHSKKDYFDFLLSYKISPAYNLAVNQFACHPLKRRAHSVAVNRRFSLKHFLTFLFTVPVLGVFIATFSAGDYVSMNITRAYVEQHKHEHLHFHVNYKNEVILYEEGEFGTTVKLEK